jgi:hypothetical protein
VFLLLKDHCLLFKQIILKITFVFLPIYFLPFSFIGRNKKLYSGYLNSLLFLIILPLHEIFIRHPKNNSLLHGHHQKHHFHPNRTNVYHLFYHFHFPNLLPRTLNLLSSQNNYSFPILNLFINYYFTTNNFI